MSIEDVGKGALPDLPDDRDFQIEALGAPPPVDWTKEFRLADPGDEDQGSSDSCVSQAWSYYKKQLHGKNYSRRDLFIRIALDYGAFIRDGGWQTVNNGQATRDEVPDPSPQNMQNMRDKSGAKQEYRDDDKDLNYFSVPKDIETTASTIRDYKGVVFGVTGTNPGWQDLLNPRPPKPGETQWGHALYGMGYHTHGTEKCIIAKSSWCNQVTEHHIKESYFNSGYTFSGWTLIPKEQFMFSNLKVKVVSLKPDGSVQEDFGVMTRTPNTDIITKAEDKAEWRSYSKQDSYAVHTINADNSTDWTVDKVFDLRTN